MKLIKGKKYILRSKKITYDNIKYKYKRTPVSEIVTYVGPEENKEVFTTERGTEILILNIDVESKITEIK